MRVLQVILGMLALLLVSIQTFRHAYVLWIEPRGSVLDRFDKTEQKIDSAQSLEELVAQFEKARDEEEQARKKAQAEWEKEKPDPENKRPNWDDPLPYHEKERAKNKFKEAIQTWEAHDKQLYQLHFYWWAGFGSMIFGVLGYFVINRWFGMTGIIAGVSEMIWWTSPPFRAGGAHAEFDRLLLLKFIYSAVTYVLIFGAWCLLSGRFSRRGKSEPVTNSADC